MMPGLFDALLYVVRVLFAAVLLNSIAIRSAMVALQHDRGVRARQPSALGGVLLAYLLIATLLTFLPEGGPR